MKGLILTFLILLNINANAQQPDIYWASESEKLTDNGFIIQGENNEIIKAEYVSKFEQIKYKKPVLLLTKFDDKMNVVAKKVIETDNDFVFYQNIGLKHKGYLLGTSYNRSSKKNTFCSQTLNTQTLELEKDLKEISSTIFLGQTFPIRKNMAREASSIYVWDKISADKTKFLQLFFLDPSSNGNTRYFVSVFDSSMNTIWARAIELPYKNKIVSLADVSVTNKGEAAFAYKVYNDGKKIDDETIKKDGVVLPNYTIRLNIVNKDNGNGEEYTPNTENNLTWDLKFFETKNNDLMLFGLYLQNFESNITGYYNIRIDFKAKTSPVKFEKFTKELVEAIKNDEQASTDDKSYGLYSAFSIHHILQRENGSIDCLLESFKMWDRNEGKSTNAVKPFS